MVDNIKTLKELATLDIMCQPWCIQYPKLEQGQSYELKSELVLLLPKFHGLAVEDPHKHFKESHGARNLISNMVGNTQQFDVRGQLAIGQHHISPPVKVCGICAFVEHPTDACPTLQETEPNGVEVSTIIGAYETCTIEFLEGFGRANGYKQHSISTKCDYDNLGLVNTYWTIGHHCESASPKVLNKFLLKPFLVNKQI
ncbi:hypothetical protein CR513_17945, partial [Mucuna pruriens]